jgi:hypothetical protein
MKVELDQATIRLLVIMALLACGVGANEVGLVI